MDRHPHDYYEELRQERERHQASLHHLERQQERESQRHARARVSKPPKKLRRYK